MNIKEVAAKAGVSITTVSRVLNSPEKVNSETKKKIIATMEEMNYTPNWFARNLQNSRTDIIGVLIPDNMQQTNMAIAKGIEKIAIQRGNNIILCNTGYNREVEKKQIRTLVERKVDGLVMVYSCLQPEDMEYIKEKKVPFVFVGPSLASENENVVYTNCRTAAKEVVRYLTDMGRKRIALILPEMQSVANEEKLKGYKEGLEISNIDFETELVVEAENTIEGGFGAANRLINGSGIVDAVFACTDTLAYGAVEAMKQNCLDSQRLGIVGFDGNDEGAIIEPKLTTVSKPAYRMGLTAGRLLFDLIETDDNSDPQSVMIQSKLKIRKSCGNTERVLEIW